jgi:hypothetical protein
VEKTTRLTLPSNDEDYWYEFGSWQKKLRAWIKQVERGNLQPRTMTFRTFDADEIGGSIESFFEEFWNDSHSDDCSSTLPAITYRWEATDGENNPDVLCFESLYNPDMLQQFVKGLVDAGLLLTDHRSLSITLQ